MMTNANNSVIYTGVTSKLRERVSEHKTHKYPQSFTARYNCHKLVCFEFLISIDEALSREKQIKAGSRQKKVLLISRLNPEWNDLSPQIKDFLN